MEGVSPMRLWLVLGALFALLAFGSWHYTASNDIAVLKAVTYKVENAVGAGTGVLIAPRRLLTAAHVADQPNLKVNQKPVKILGVDRVNDIALLEVEADCPCIPVGKELAKQYTKVVISGYPAGIALIMTEGRIQGLYATEQYFKDSPKLLTTANGYFGNSGGGVFVRTLLGWELQGIFTNGYQDCNSPFQCTVLTYIGFSTPITAITEFLKYQVDV